LIYSGGDVTWTNSKLDNCNVQLHGAAQRTAALMANFGILPKPSTVSPTGTTGGAVN
jgi:hypothetical protein